MSSLLSRKVAELRALSVFSVSPWLNQIKDKIHHGGTEHPEKIKASSIARSPPRSSRRNATRAGSRAPVLPMTQSWLNDIRRLGVSRCATAMAHGKSANGKGSGYDKSKDNTAQLERMRATRTRIAADTRR